MKYLSNPAHGLSVGELLDELRQQGKRIYHSTIRALARDREPTRTEVSAAWSAVDEAAADQIRRWDYFQHPEIKA